MKKPYFPQSEDFLKRPEKQASAYVNVDFKCTQPPSSEETYESTASINQVLQSDFALALQSPNPLVAQSARLYASAISLMVAKNADYTQGGHPLKNFQAGEGWGCTPVQSIACRLEDKLQRLRTFVLGREAKVKSETLEDTIIDAINYLSILLFAMGEQK